MVPFTLSHAGKYRTEDKFKMTENTQTKHDLRKSKQYKTQQNKTTYLPLTTLGEETRWAYSIALLGPHRVFRVVWGCDNCDLGLCNVNCMHACVCSTIAGICCVLCVESESAPVSNAQSKLARLRFTSRVRFSAASTSKQPSMTTALTCS